MKAKPAKQVVVAKKPLIVIDASGYDENVNISNGK